jgi:hypothetical protein
MFDIAFWALFAFYFLIGVRFDQWTTISILGFGSETPQAFLENPGGFQLLRTVLFLAAAASLLEAAMPWPIGLTILGVGWFGTTWLGQTLAFRSFRAICRDLAQHGESEEDRAFARSNSAKSNAQLREVLAARSKQRT